MCIEGLLSWSSWAIWTKRFVGRGLWLNNGMEIKVWSPACVENDCRLLFVRAQHSDVSRIYLRLARRKSTFIRRV